MEHNKVPEEGDVEHEGQGCHSSRSHHDAGRRDAVLAQNNGMGNDHEGNPNGQVTEQQPHPQDEQHQVQGCEKGRGKTRLQSKRKRYATMRTIAAYSAR